MISKKQLTLTILTLNLMLIAGCNSTSKPPVPYQEGVDYIALEKGQNLTAPVRGQFLSDTYYKYREEACK